ncbi:hypothetical protein H4R99_000702 [Coemansia sp. RSA 1722]|nr:hypothetical protein IWW45_000656 [Coemansia sp. RSA 485]KAJ2602476.1 hypothetical protein GGF39_000685 [Coemansia sp. RSA 1721]KAJ2605999.1 hypothetical protein H4R99_000702 [Coemansia sp. RSA 1722]KAJ2639612.1 hypothetical protein GGF40_000726 [Coemansia sp. RSA 1286]
MEHLHRSLGIVANTEPSSRSSSPPPSAGFIRKPLVASSAAFGGLASGLCGHLHSDTHLPHVRSGSQTSLASLINNNNTSTLLNIPTIRSSLSLETSGQAREIQVLSTPGEDTSASILALAQTPDLVYGGTQNGHIHVWRRDTFRLVQTVQAHTAGCLTLAIDLKHNILYSGGSDGRVHAWDAEHLEPLFDVYAAEHSGAILSLAYFEELDALAMGCQNASIQWFDVGNRHEIPGDRAQRELAARRSRFFDASDAAIAVCPSNAPLLAGGSPDSGHSTPAFVVEQSMVAAYAHSGYVYSVVAGSLPSGDPALFSAGGDGVVRIWRVVGDHVPEPIATLARDAIEDECVHALALGTDGLLFAGLQSGAIDVWDLETMQRIRELSPGDMRPSVYALRYTDGFIFAGAADGRVRVWTGDLSEVGYFATAAAASPVLALAGGDGELVVGGRRVGFWDVAALGGGESSMADPPEAPLAISMHRTRRHGTRMLNALAQWVRLRSVSGVPELQPECRRAARFLRDLMRQLGASDARLLATTAGANPLVYGRFDASNGSGSSSGPESPSVLVYGHYDVMPAGDEHQWTSRPFELSGRDGYLYGRGVTDDKGPVLATLFAVAELAAANALTLPVVFCIEGEEERGSAGLHEAMETHRALFGAPRLILLSSSYWLGETTPCLTYGMRGSIRANLRIESSRAADVHAGVWGGAVSEPLTCLAHVLSRLADPAGRVLVPGFHDAVRAVSSAEQNAMRRLVEWITDKEARAPLVTRTAQSPAPDETRALLFDQLMQRWRFPTLTVHHVDVSTVAARSNTTLVPAAAQASLSVRVVPDQSLDDIAHKLRAHIEDAFSQVVAHEPALLDTLTLHLDVQPVANWWLADPNTPVYRAAAKAIRDEWAVGVDDVPLLIREGGSIPAVPWLESFFAPHAVAVNLPMGQSSDNAHLDNERISLENLMHGRQVVYRLLKDIGDVIPAE